MQSHQLGHHAPRSAVARRARRRCGHRARRRSRRASRHVHRDRSRHADRHLRFGAADRRGGGRAGDCCRGHQRCEQHRRRIRSWRCRRADRHRLFPLPRGDHFGTAPTGARRAWPRDGHHRCVEREAGTRNFESLYQRAGADQSGAPVLSFRHTRARAAAQGGRSEGIRRLLVVLVGAGGRAASRESAPAS